MSIIWYKQSCDIVNGLADCFLNVIYLFYLSNYPLVVALRNWKVLMVDCKGRVCHHFALLRFYFLMFNAFFINSRTASLLFFSPASMRYFKTSFHRLSSQSSMSFLAIVNKC